MTTFITTEKQNSNSRRDGIKIEAKNLTAAKRAATKAQVFVGTVLTIENETGEVVSIKEGKCWSDNRVACDYK